MLNEHVFGIYKVTYSLLGASLSSVTSNSITTGSPHHHISRHTGGAVAPSIAHLNPGVW